MWELRKDGLIWRRCMGFIWRFLGSAAFFGVKMMGIDELGWCGYMPDYKLGPSCLDINVGWLGQLAEKGKNCRQKRLK